MHAEAFILNRKRSGQLKTTCDLNIYDRYWVGAAVYVPASRSNFNTVKFWLASVLRWDYVANTLASESVYCNKNTQSGSQGGVNRSLAWAAKPVPASAYKLKGDMFAACNSLA